MEERFHVHVTKAHTSFLLHAVSMNRLCQHSALLINAIFHYSELMGTSGIAVGLLHMPIKHHKGTHMPSKYNKGNPFYSLSPCSCPSTSKQISQAHILTSTNLHLDEQGNVQ